MNYARIRFIDRPAPQTIYYATAGFQQEPKGVTKGDNFPVPTQWAAWEKRLQSLQAWEVQYKPHAWLVNVDGTPREEYITTAGNIVSYDTPVVNNHILVRAFNKNEDPKNIVGMETINYLTHPELVHKVTAMSHTLQVYNPGPNLNMYHIITDNGDGGPYMDLSQVELFPTLPCTVTVKALPWLNIRSNYQVDALKVGQYLPGSRIVILEYRPVGSDVWGRTDKGWVCLQKYRSFYTSWSMATQPPIPE